MLHSKALVETLVACSPDWRWSVGRDHLMVSEEVPVAEPSQRSEPSAIPDCLTIEEAARILRIGRTAAYGLARLWRESDGKAGIPYIAFGASYRVPTGALESMLGRRITHIPEPKRRNTGGRSTEDAARAGERGEGADLLPLRTRQPKQRPSGARSSRGGQGSLL